MPQKRRECTKVIKSDHRIDGILANARNTKKKGLSIVGKPYFLEDRKGLKHITYPPGFASGFDTSKSSSAISSALDRNAFDTAFLMFLDAGAASEFENQYNINQSHILTKLSQRQLITLDLKNKKEEDLLNNIAHGNRQKIKSQGTPYKILNNYDKAFHNLYEDLAQEKDFSQAYHYSKEDLVSLANQDNIFFAGIEVEDKVLAASFFRLVENAKEKRMDYLLSASLPSTSSKWTNRVIWQGIRLALEKNCKSFNFGGGVKDGDSLHKFKLGFGGESIPFYHCRVINRLGSQKEKLLSQKILDNPFFP